MGKTTSMIETIDALLLAIPFVLIAAFVVHTMAATSRAAAWAAPAPVRSSKVRLGAATISAGTISASTSDVHESFVGAMSLETNTELAAAA